MEPLFKVNGIFPVFAANQDGFSFEAITDNFAYIIDATGWKQFRRNGMAVSLMSVTSIDGLPKFEAKIKLTSAKIPIELIKQVTAFFAAVYKKNKTEAIGYLYYHADNKEWDFIPPVQTATGATAKYEEAPKKSAGWLVAGTIHSHGSMTAFHSGTDKADEEYWDGIHITIGRVDSSPEFSCSVVAQKDRVKYDDPGELIEGWNFSATVPDNWMAAVKLSEPDLTEDPKVGKAVAKLYSRYLTGQVCEDKYLQELEKLEERADSKPIIDASSKPRSPSALGFFDARRYQPSHKWGSYGG